MLTLVNLLETPVFSTFLKKNKFLKKNYIIIIIIIIIIRILNYYF